MKIKAISIISIFAQLIFFQAGYCCQCQKLPNTFYKNLRKDHIIIRAKVIEHNENSIAPGIIPWSFTKLQIIEQYYGQINQDTIIFLNGGDWNCEASIFAIEPGQEIIIKSKKTSYKGTKEDLKFFGISDLDNPKDSFYIKELETYEAVKYGTCDLWILEVQENQVMGEITRNNGNRKFRNYKFRKIFSEKWADKYDKNKKFAAQNFSLEKFERKLTRKLDAL